VKLILCRNNSVGSWLLRSLMWGRWSHSALWDRDRHVVVDTTLWQGGVRVHDEADFFDHYPTHEVRDLGIPPENYAAARAWIEAQVGKPYDWTALVSFVVHRNWQDDDSWFCSEFLENIRNLFGLRVFRADASRITPQHQAMIS
jgi:uncharacterized protein YycO